MNRYVKIPGGRFYSPSLKDVHVALLERAQLIFLIFHTFVCNFGRVEGAAREKITDKKLASSIQPTFFKLDEYNLLLSILMLRFINCVKINFEKSHLSLDSHSNSVIF